MRCPQAGVLPKRAGSEIVGRLFGRSRGIVAHEPRCCAVGGQALKVVKSYGEYLAVGTSSDEAFFAGAVLLREALPASYHNEFPGRHDETHDQEDRRRGTRHHP